MNKAQKIVLIVLAVIILIQGISYIDTISRPYGRAYGYVEPKFSTFIVKLLTFSIPGGIAYIVLSNKKKE